VDSRRQAHRGGRFPRTDASDVDRLRDQRDLRGVAASRVPGQGAHESRVLSEARPDRGGARVLLSAEAACLRRAGRGRRLWRGGGAAGGTCAAARRRSARALGRRDPHLPPARLYAQRADGRGAHAVRELADWIYTTRLSALANDVAWLWPLSES